MSRDLEFEVLGDQETEFEYEAEFEDELEMDGEFEYTPEASYEEEDEFESEFSLESPGEMEEEAIFRRMLPKIGRFVRGNLPLFKKLARVAVPMIGTAVGGPAGGLIGGKLASILKEDEFEMEDELLEQGASFEEEFEIPLSASPVIFEAEILGALATNAETEIEAEGFIGALATTALKKFGGKRLLGVLPSMIKGTVPLVRLIGKRSVTRPLFRALPTILERTAQRLVRVRSSGRRLTAPVVGRLMSEEVMKFFSNPHRATQVLTRNFAVTRRAVRNIKPETRKAPQYGNSYRSPIRSTARA